MGAAQCKQACNDLTTKLDTQKTSGEQGYCLSAPWYSDVEVDANGCRIFPQIPPPGHHPRLLFTEEEIPALLAKHTHSELRDILRSNTSQAVAMFRRYHAEIAALSDTERTNPGRETLIKFFKVDEQRNNCLLSTYIHAFFENDKDLTAMVKESVLFHATIVTASEHMARTSGCRDRPFDIWHSTFWDMGTSVLFGGAAFALLYDILYPSLDVNERDTIRKSISLAIHGRRAWGMGFPPRRIQSNWAPYMGDLYILAAAIEGEEGCDEEVMRLFEQTMVNYIDFAIYDSGHPVEDAYCPNLAFREGAVTYLAMARRGFNVFQRAHFIDIWRKWLPFALESHADGSVYGGSSGNSFTYPTAAIIVKYMYPKDRVIDFGYRHFLRDSGKEYNKLKLRQCRDATALFALPSMFGKMDFAERDYHDASDLELPRTFFCENRGKVIMKSNWTQDALSFTLDARPDGFLIGHDTASRGAFVLSANGRRWGDCPEWNLFKESQDYSLITIDAIGQEAKAPFVKLLECVEGEQSSTFASADLTYAANYTWTQWAKNGVDMSSQGWEHEPHDPRDFGMTAWWLPKKIYNEPNVSFAGLNQWRKRFNSVKKVTRSAMMVRAPDEPFVILCDDAVKDEDEHEYAWCMTTPEDVTLLSFDGQDAVLGEKGGEGRRLLVRILDSNGGDNVQCRLDAFSKPDPKVKLADGTCKQIPFARLQIKYRARGMHLKLGFFPMKDSGVEMPKTSWSPDRKVLSVNSTTDVCFTDNASTAMKMEVINKL